MMILVDTSVWIDFFRGKEPLFSTLRAQVEKQNVCTAQCIFGELLQGARNTRERKLLMEYWHALPKLDESDIFIAAGEFSSTYKLTSRGVGLIDAAIIQLTKRNDLQIWTLDRKLLGILQDREIYTI